MAKNLRSKTGQPHSDTLATHLGRRSMLIYVATLIITLTTQGFFTYQQTKTDIYQDVNQLVKQNQKQLAETTSINQTVEQLGTTTSFRRSIGLLRLYGAFTDIRNPLTLSNQELLK